MANRNAVLAIAIKLKALTPSNEKGWPTVNLEIAAIINIAAPKTTKRFAIFFISTSLVNYCTIKKLRGK